MWHVARHGERKEQGRREKLSGVGEQERRYRGEREREHESEMVEQGTRGKWIDRRRRRQDKQKKRVEKTKDKERNKI